MSQSASFEKPDKDPQTEMTPTGGEDPLDERAMERAMELPPDFEETTDGNPPCLKKESGGEPGDPNSAGRIG